MSNKKSLQADVFTPLLLNPQMKFDWQEIQKLMLGAEVVDAFPEAIEDLFKIQFPFINPETPEYNKTFTQYKEKYYPDSDWSRYGIWAYYSWRNCLVHIPNQEQYLALRTSRNKFLITPEEQSKFYNSHIGISGLSVGSSVLSAIVLSGGGKYLRIADPDTLAITNLNRLQSSLFDVTKSKALNAARKVQELDPYAQVKVFKHGLRTSLLDQFFLDEKPLDLFIEEMDDIKLKVVTRFYARNHKIPVVMATDNGDNAIVDVERFDLEPKRPLFHGKIDEKVLKNVGEKLSMAEKVYFASQIVGNDITPRTKISLQMVGTKLPTWPQLGNAAILSGTAVSYIARRILTGQTMPSGRYEISLDQAFDTDYATPHAKHYRQQVSEEYLSALKLIFGVE